MIPKTWVISPYWTASKIMSLKWMIKLKNNTSRLWLLMWKVDFKPSHPLSLSLMKRMTSPSWISLNWNKSIERVLKWLPSSKKEKASLNSRRIQSWSTLLTTIKTNQQLKKIFKSEFHQLQFNKNSNNKIKNFKNWKLNKIKSERPNQWEVRNISS